MKQKANPSDGSELVDIDETDRAILFELDKNSRITIPALGSIVEKTRQTVEYRIRRMERLGLIRNFYASFNPHRLGYHGNKLYLKLRNIPEEKKRLLNKMLSSRKVWWLGECSGSWDLMVAFFCRTDYEFFFLKNEILAEFHNIIVDSFVATLLDVYEFPKMFLTYQEEPGLQMGGDIVENELDYLEFSLLEEIIRNARLPMTQLAAKLSSTPAVLNRKLRKLEELGIIIRYRVDIDISKLGLNLYKTMIIFDRYRQEDEAAVLRHISKIPNIHLFIRNLGSLELELVVRDYQELQGIIGDLKREFPYLMLSADSVLLLTDVWTPGFPITPRH